MRKHQQRQILEFLQTIREAQSAGMYADCQDGAVVVGEFIESIAGEGTRTVGLLEEYCELLFKASNGEIGERQLDKQLVQIENSVRSELKPNRVEMVFLSYKASMSDSIESIYLAAKADPSCDAFWIPVPYYDRKPDGTLGELHYEGADHYGEDIECTDWREYDIEARRPDAIFTFNPYDAGNYVTSVHPDYYCERLRGFTDMLVYVPYFVSSGEIAEPYCTGAGCIFAHKVIAQSEKIRDLFIKYFKDKYGAKFGRPEDKFIALGSPKFDKVKSARREDQYMPEAWQKLIEDRKAILYNTTVSSMLASGELYLKKLHSVFDTFRDRSDVVLWWRPHPLGRPTFESMRPQLLKEYEQLIKDYRHEGWGIYDETPDLHGAITWTDAYYGDWSSLTALYAATGKPIMIQNAYYHSDNASLQSLQFENLYDDGQYLWFTAYNFNALFKMDKQTLKAEYMGSFPGEKTIGFRLFREIVAHDGKLYFAPGSAEKIGVYDIRGGSFSSIEFDNESKALSTNRKFTFACVYEDEIFFVGNSYPAIISYDVSSGLVRRYDDWVEQAAKIRTGKDGHYFRRGEVLGNTLLLPLCRADAIVEFDMDERKSTIRKLRTGCSGFVDICVNNEQVWLAALSENTMVCWNRADNTISKYEIPDIKCELPNVSDPSEYAGYCHLLKIGGELYHLPMYSDRAVKINLTTGEISTADMFQQECESTHVPGKDNLLQIYTFAATFGKSIYAKTGRSNSFVEYNFETGTRREVFIDIPPKLLADLKKTHLTMIEQHGERKQVAECFFFDSFYFDLSDLIHYASKDINSKAAFLLKQQQLDAAAELRGRPDAGAGRAIYEYCINEVM